MKCPLLNAMLATALPVSQSASQGHSPDYRLTSEDVSMLASVMKRTQSPDVMQPRERLIAARLERQAKNTPGWIIKKRRKLHAAMMGKAS